MNNYEELYHYGVVGMKWGVRRDKRVKDARKKYKEANKEYSKAYRKYTNTYFGKKRKDAAYDDMYSKAQKAEQAEKQYKKTKQKVQSELKGKQHEDYTKAHDKTNVRNMSDAELKKRLNRLQMEKQYKKLNPTEVDKGKEYINNVIKTAGSIAALLGTMQAIDKGYDNVREIIERRIRK